jgi:AMP nucleosidase
MKLWRRGRSGLDDDRAFCKPAPHPTKDPSMTAPSKHLPIETPEALGERRFTDAGEAVAYLVELYDTATGFLREKFRAWCRMAGCRPRGTAPSIPRSASPRRPTGQVDSRLAFGHVAEPGTYMTTVTRPDLFGNYLRQQIGLLLQNHGVPVYVGPSATPIPVHFAVLNDAEVQVPQEGAMSFPLRDAFDVPDLQSTHDDIVNGFGFTYEDGSGALAPSRRSASTIRWRGCRITPRPCRSISRTTSCSRTTSSTWTSS